MYNTIPKSERRRAHQLDKGERESRLRCVYPRSPGLRVRLVYRSERKGPELRAKRKSQIDLRLSKRALVQILQESVIALKTERAGG
jgi:hypothetical protein